MSTFKQEAKAQDVKITLTAAKKSGKVLLDFGTKIQWLGLDYDQAIALSEGLRDKALQLRGITP